MFELITAGPIIKGLTLLNGLCYFLDFLFLDEKNTLYCTFYLTWKNLIDGRISNFLYLGHAGRLRRLPRERVRVPVRQKNSEEIRRPHFTPGIHSQGRR